MKRTIHRKQFLPYPPALVWEALTDHDILGKWFMQNDIEPIIGHEFTFRMAPQKGWDGITYCTVTEIEEMKKIAYTYQGYASGEKALACAGIHSELADSAGKGIFAELDTILEFDLEPTCGGTILRMKQSGYKGLKMTIVSFIMAMGWKKQLGKKLPTVLEKMV